MAFEPIDISTEFKSDFFYHGKTKMAQNFHLEMGKELSSEIGKY